MSTINIAPLGVRTPFKPTSHLSATIARRVLAVVDQGLVLGSGKPIPGKMCVEAAVCYAMGEEHSDEPKCVDYALTDLKIALNDTLPWSSPKARAKGLRRIAIAQLGSKDHFDESVFWTKSKKMFERVYYPHLSTGDKELVQEDWYGGIYDVLNAFCCFKADDTVSATFVEHLVQILVEMKVPGTKYLYLAPFKGNLKVSKLKKREGSR